MMRIENRLAVLALTALLAGVGCGDDALPNPGDLIPDGGLPDNPLGDPTKNPAFRAIGEACGLDIDCKAGGIAEGNASISGVAEVDSFFQAAIDFQTTADAISAGINAEVQAIASDFGVAGEADVSAALKAKIGASVDGGLSIKYEPVRCAVDAQASIEAQAKCDVTVKPGSAMVACEGSCEVEASAKVECGAEATLRCTIVPPMGACEGECSGTCEADVGAKLDCSGTCHGECDGTCELKDGQGDCAGKCDGECKGSCEFEMAGEAKCEGSCRGECTFTPPDGNCEGGIRASCEAEAGAMVMCSGKCEGSFEPPEAKAECEASAKAQASLNVECTPPRVVIDYELNAELSAEAKAEFVAAIKNLEVRLPSLLAKIKRAEIVVDAGKGLVADGSAAVKSSVQASIKAVGEANLSAVFGLSCALKELPNVGGAIAGSSAALGDSVSEATSITTGLGM